MALPALAAEIPHEIEGYQSHVKNFFSTYCVECHGPEKSKGKITLHSLNGDLSEGMELERWEAILDVLEFEEMPPEEEKQPSSADREAVAKWIDQGLRDYVKKASSAAPHTTRRRLTNFEYQNTMRDLFGFELDYMSKLPEDPEKPYHFNNTSEFMMLGPDQMDRYLENARRALASAIVDPEMPEVIRHSWDFSPRSGGIMGGQRDEIPISGGAKGGPARGVPFKTWPKTGEYRIKVKAAAILPKGFDEVPLRIVMGEHLRGDSGTGNHVPVGMVNLSNTVDELREIEFRGRIENHPIHIGKVGKTGKLPDMRYIYAQNLYDNGSLNDTYDKTRGASAREYPRAVVRSIEFEAPVVDVWPPEHHTRILPDSELRTTDPDGYVRNVLLKFMARAFRRPPTDEEVDRFFRLYKALKPDFGTPEATMRETLAMVLISHQFLYHTQHTEGVVSPDYELASRLSYFLWGSMPDVDLFYWASRGVLNQPETLESQIRRMLADEKARDFVENFTMQWLSIRKMKAVNINAKLFPRALHTVGRGERTGTEVLFRPTKRDYLFQETIGFIHELIRRNASALSVVDSDFAWLNEPMAAHYGIEGVKGIDFRAVALKPEDWIGGLPTHASVLIGNGTGSTPHPIYRAVWLREAILGDKVKEPPAEVPALADSAGDSADQATTIKDLLAKHREDPSCNECHVRLDPWGIPFERYNAVGQYQPFVPKEGTAVSGFNRGRFADMDAYQAYLKEINTIEVDARARVPHGPEVNGMEDLKSYLLKDRKEAIPKNLIRRFLSYGLGRELGYRDRYTVEELFKQTKASNHALQDMILAVCMSEPFLQPTIIHQTQ